MSRRYTDILRELHERTHRDGYFCDKGALEKILDELIEEMGYLALVTRDDHLYLHQATSCTLPEKDFA